MSFIPAIISGIVIYFQGKKKIENENIVKFPIVLVIFIGISLIGSIVQYTLETKNRKFIQEYSKNNDLLNLDKYSKQEETTNETSQLLTLSYNVVSTGVTVAQFANIDVFYQSGNQMGKQNRPDQVANNKTE
jgi:hypothetical protein